MKCIRLRLVYKTVFARRTRAQPGLVQAAPVAKLKQIGLRTTTVSHATLATHKVEHLLQLDVGHVLAVHAEFGKLYAGCSIHVPDIHFEIRHLDDQGCLFRPGKQPSALDVR